MIWSRILVKKRTLIHKEDNHMNREQVMVDFSSLALHLFNILNHDGKGIKLGAKISRHKHDLNR